VFVVLIDFFFNFFVSFPLGGETNRKLISNISSQNNTECGVLVLFHAYCIAGGFQDFTFSLRDCSTLRKKIFLEILQWKIDQEDDD
jgi:hypothetical protein